MWKDDAIWLPSFILENKILKGYFKFSGEEEILEYNVE
jgi:hypothetical protein